MLRDLTVKAIRGVANHVEKRGAHNGEIITQEQHPVEPYIDVDKWLANPGLHPDYNSRQIIDEVRALRRQLKELTDADLDNTRKKNWPKKKKRKGKRDHRSYAHAETHTTNHWHLPQLSEGAWLIIVVGIIIGGGMFYKSYINPDPPGTFQPAASHARTYNQ